MAKLEKIIFFSGGYGYENSEKTVVAYNTDSLESGELEDSSFQPMKFDHISHGCFAYK